MNTRKFIEVAGCLISVDGIVLATVDKPSLRWYLNVAYTKEELDRGFTWDFDSEQEARDALALIKAELLKAE